MATLFFTCTGKLSHLFLNLSFLFLLSLCVATHLHISYPGAPHQSPGPPRSPHSSLRDSGESCSSLHRFEEYKERCAYVSSEAQCKPEGYINYLQLFYCTYGRYPILGYIVLILWLVLLFYLLGNTAANYFCSSLEGLSGVLNLPPTIAGVTLLSLGNGAPDVFSSLVSFMGTSTGDVGLNSILGGAFFVSSVVTGVISICVGSSKISVDKPSFIRDVCFLLIAISALTLIIAIGKINIWGAVAFTSLYFVYVFLSSTAHYCQKKEGELCVSGTGPLLPVNSTSFCEETEKNGTLETSLLVPTETNDSVSTMREDLQNDGQELKMSYCGFSPPAAHYFRMIVNFLELPLYVMRRLTIPDALEERWSKPCAVISVSFAPLLLAALWNSQRGDMRSKSSLVAYLIGVLIGIVFGITALLTTENSSPPKRFLLPWLAGGFLMTVVWTYVTAEELVSLLVSLGVILGISPSILGITLLAWGNSIGDLIANVLMARNSGPEGAQVAISGCYAGPIFNTLIGLGVSLGFCSWSVYPYSYVIPNDPSLYQTIGFLTGGLLWAIVILPGRGMRLDRVLGVGLLAIYASFLSVRIAQSLGLVQLHGFRFFPSAFSFKATRRIQSTL
uniref:Cation/calcium exchanger 1 n=1 Tax=Anthurium amnicola TaxID=1678845 RepID=A0A1D1YQ23_9ARAE